MKKIGISTVFTGYNYGSALQAYATKHLIEELGYEAVMTKMSGSIIRGHDVRFKKVVAIAFNTLIKPANAEKNIGAYRQSLSITLPDKAKKSFNEFIDEHLKPQITSWKKLKNEAQSDEYFAFICGSDQIWNADTYYVDPHYYLKYAPEYKRIAFAPSFGRPNVPDYNKKIISKYISEIPCLSVREDSGAKIIKDLINREAEVLVDPTLLLNRSEWESQFGLSNIINQKYLLAYFLNEPSEDIKRLIKGYAEKNGLSVIGIPYSFGNGFADIVYPAGPQEFLSLVDNAEIVCTDSFHGTAFCLNFETPFYTFERNYGNAASQSTRIVSLLKMTNTIDRYYKSGELKESEIDFSNISTILKNEKNKSMEYLSQSLKKVADNE